MLGCAVAADGTLSPVQLAPTSTRYPRGMELSPDGTELLVAGQGSGNLVTRLNWLGPRRWPAGARASESGRGGAG